MSVYRTIGPLVVIVALSLMLLQQNIRMHTHAPLVYFLDVVSLFQLNRESNNDITLLISLDVKTCYP